MKAFIHVILVILKIVNIVSFACTVLLSIWGVYDQIVGSANAEKLLEILHIPLSYNQVITIWTVCIALMVISYILRVKLSKRV